MDEFEQLYSSLSSNGKSDDEIYSSLVLSGYNSSQVRQYMEYAKKKSEAPTKEYGQKPSNFQQKIYSQVAADGTVSASESGFTKPLSESSYSAATKVDFEPVGDPVDGMQSYKPTSIIEVGQPRFGAEGAALGEIEKNQNFPGFSDPMSLRDLMAVDESDKKAFMSLVNLTVPEEERAGIMSEYEFAFDPEPSDAINRKTFKESLVNKMGAYKKKFFNSRIREAISGEFQDGQDPVGVEKYILDNYGFNTQLDDNPFVGTDEGVYGQVANLFVPNAKGASDSFIAAGLKMMAAASPSIPRPLKDEYFDTMYNYFGFEERRKQRENEMAEGRAVRFMADEEMESIGMHVDKMLITPLSWLGLREGMSDTERIEMFGNSPSTLSSQLAGGIAAAGALASTKSMSAAGWAYTIAQSTFMGLQVMGQEYGSTYSDPRFYNYFTSDGDPVDIKEATTINEYGDLVIKDGYSRKHDHFRAAGHAEVAAGSEFAGEFMGNVIMVKGGGMLMRGAGIGGVNAKIGQEVYKATGKAGLGRAAQYLAGGAQAATLGSWIEGQEEVVTEILQDASKKQYSQQSGASAYGLYRQAYENFINPDLDLQKAKKTARSSGEFFGALFGGAIATANVVQNEVARGKAIQGTKSNKRYRDKVLNKNFISDGKTPVVHDAQFVHPDNFPTYEAWENYEANRQNYLQYIANPLNTERALIAMGMSRKERKAHLALMKELNEVSRTLNDDGDVDVEAILSAQKRIAAKLDKVRGNIFISDSILDDLISTAKQGDFQSADLLLKIAKVQMDLGALTNSLNNPNLGKELTEGIKADIRALEDTNNKLVEEAYKQAEGKGFRYTIVTDPQSASEGTVIQQWEADDIDRNSYTLRYTNVSNISGGVLENTASGEFAFSEIGNAATEVTDEVDELNLNKQQTSDLNRLRKASPNARVIIHDTQDSLDKVGSRANLIGKNAFTLQDSDGRVFEIHLKKDYTTDVIEEEFLHYQFNDQIYKDEFRSPIISAINKAIEKDPTGSLAEFVRIHNARVAGSNQKYIEVELITNLAKAIAKGEHTYSGATIKKSDVESALSLNKSEFRGLVNKFDKYLKGKGEVKEMAYLPSQVDNEVEVEGTAASYKPTFLDGKRVSGHIPTSAYDASRSTEVSTIIKDYNHYRNWYAKMTGNNKRPLQNMSFVDDNGKIIPISDMPGHDVTDGRPLDWRGKELFYKRDYKTKEIIPMDIVPLTYSEKQRVKYRAENEQIASRKESERLRFLNLNRISMDALGINLNTFAQRFPNLERETDDMGNDIGFTQGSLEILEVALAEEAGVMPLAPRRATVPVPRVPKNMSGDIVEGTASAAKLAKISYSASEESDLLKRFEVDNITDIDISQLQGEFLHPGLALAILGHNGATIQFDKYAGMRQKLSVLRITPDGNPSIAKADMTSGSTYLMNEKSDRDGMVTIAANTDPSAAGVIRSAVEMAKKNNEPLILGYLSLGEENVFSDPGGFNFIMEEVVAWHLDKYGDTPLISGKNETTMVEAIAEGINSAISKPGMKNLFLPQATEDAQKAAGVRYPFSATSSVVEKEGFKGEKVYMPEPNLPQLVKNEFGSYDKKTVMEAIKLIIKMSDQYESIMVSRAGFGGRKTIATSILSNLKKIENPNQKTKGKNTSRKFLFSEGVKNPNSIKHYTGLMNDPDYKKSETHVYALVKPDLVSSADYVDSTKTYRFGIKAKENGVYFFRSKPEYNLNEKSLFGQTLGANVKKGAEQTLFSVDGTANTRRLGRISYTNGPGWQASEATGFGKALDAVALKLQDKYHDVMLLQKDIEEFRGRRMAVGNDFNLAVDLMYGKTRNDLDGLDQSLQEIKDMMAAEGIKSDELSDFMYALHARERNAKIMAERADMESGSGMTNDEAEEIIDRLGTNAMRRLSSMVLSISQDTRDTMRKFGLETDETIDAYEDMYEYYVPLSGLSIDEMDDATSSYPTGGMGMAVYGPTTRKAKGRKSKTDVNIVAQVVMQNARVKQLARKNEALLSLHSMFSGNPNENVFSLWSPKRRMETIEKGGKVRKMSDSEMRARPDMVALRINGEQHFIQFKNEHFAKTINGLSVDPTNIITNAMRKPAQWLRNVFTVYDPNFFVTNFSRDIQSAMYNALAEAERSDGTVSGVRVSDLTKELIKNTSMSLRGLLNENAFGKEMSPELVKFYEEWKESGGQTGWGYTNDIDSIIKELENDAKKGLPGKVWKTATNVADYIEGVNEAFENSIRLSAYISARNLGVTKDRAAQLSKNITVNFNRSGEWGSTLNSVYLFFNAAMQGNARILRSMFYMKDTKKPNGELESWHKRTTNPQKLAFGMATLSALTTMINLASSDKDEDGELFYNKIPDYEKERNLIIMTNGKGYIKVPLPYGFNLFNNLGMTMVETMSGNRDADDAMMFLATSAISSFSPISFGQSENLMDYFVKATAFTPIKPLVEVAMNETYFGEKVYMEQLPFGTKRPESEMAFRSPEVIQDFFKWLNEATGGSKYKSGDVDLNFDPYWYLFEYLGGGSGRFIGQSGQAIYDIGQTMYSVASEASKANDLPSFLKKVKEAPVADIKLSRVPIARKVYGEASKYYDYDLFEENSEQVMQLRRELKEGLSKNYSPSRYKGINPLYNSLRETEKRMKELREKRKRAKDIKDYIKRSERITAIMEAERLAMVRFNKEYERQRGEKN
jgi:hypothetical protein